MAKTNAGFTKFLAKIKGNGKKIKVGKTESLKSTGKPLDKKALKKIAKAQKK